jgi:hypothetical protein
MPRPHFLQIGGVAFTVLAVFERRVDVSPGTSNPGAAADMTKTPLFGESKRTQIGECNAILKRTKYAPEFLIEY